MSDQDRNRQRSNADRTRVPPHNIGAEESCLGAALVARSAAEAITERLTPADYYRPAHRHIAAAVGQLVAAGEPVDVVTVGERLRRSGLLDEVGGLGALHELQNATPSISAAAHHAKIVAEAAALRRLLYASADIAEIAYGNPDDTADAVTRAQEIVEQLARGSADALSTLEIADIPTLLAGDLTPEEPQILTRTDSASLFYAGKMHMLQAEPTSGKSWIACAAVVEVLALGGAAVYLDFEDTATGILARLLGLGAAAADVRERFVYVNPAGPFGPTERIDLARIIDRLNPDLVIIDGVAEALSRSGYSEDKADDIVRWTEQLPRWVSRTGAAVVMLDHVAKDPEQRGRWARGSGAKLAVVDGATYQVKIVRAFDRHHTGLLKMVVAKDRPGGVGPIGHTAAVVTIEPHAGGERVVVTIDPDTAEIASTDTWKPTIIMQKVSEALEGSSVPLTATALRAMVHTDKPRLVTEAIARLTAEGYLTEGRGRGKPLTLVKPYRDGNAPSSAPAPPEPPAPLFEMEPDVPDEPDWLHQARREMADAIIQDPDI